MSVLPAVLVLAGLVLGLACVNPTRYLAAVRRRERAVLDRRLAVASGVPRWHLRGSTRAVLDVGAVLFVAGSFAVLAYPSVPSFAVGGGLAGVGLLLVMWAEFTRHWRAH